MKKFKFFFIALLSMTTVGASAQIVPPSTNSRPRVVGSATPTPTPSKVVVVKQMPTPTLTPTPSPKPTATPVKTIVSPIPSDTAENPFPLPTPTPVQPQTNYKTLGITQLKAKIAEAKSMLQSRPLTIASVESTTVDMKTVRLAFYHWKTKRVDYVSLSKDLFLTKDAQLPLLSFGGSVVNVRIIRANGVNTPVTVFDQTGEVQVPLLIQYPVERDGRYAETAYYISTHTGIVTPDVITAGKMYVRNTIDIARENLRKKGIVISPQLADFAERLATVEHVDHQRFRNEYHQNIYNDIFTLYALNEGQTYRYSVSRAGAGGMVQMIPSTYYMVRNRYYGAGLMPDFVEGMRNHGNAAQAMLLYMQMTWDDLISRDTIYNAIEDGTAAPHELMAAGYNSNPAKLAGYIKRGGNNWRSLIPRETKIYLQIYSSLEKFVPMTARAN